MTRSAATISSFDGRNRFLSNYYGLNRRHLIGELEFWTTEAAFQAMKTQNMRQRRLIATAVTPGEAKALGRKVDLVPQWDLLRYGVMYSLVEDKFWSDERLAIKLADNED